MKKAFIIAVALLVCVAAGAQKKATTTKAATTQQSATQPKAAAQPAAQPAQTASTSAKSTASASKKQFIPAKGDFSFGVTWNPISKFGTYQPNPGDFAGGFVKSLGDYPHELYILGIDPQFSFQLRYHMSDQWSLRTALGLSGSKVNYKEYVTSDANANAKVEDCIHSNLNGVSLGLEAEYTKSFGPLAFIGGFGLQFAIGGGSMTMDYGNPFVKNALPATMPYLSLSTADVQTLNEYQSLSGNFHAAQVTHARPLERYNVGYCKALALTCNMGIEYFFIGQMSITAAVTFVPVAFFFQPETYTRFEGWYYNSNTDQGRKEYEFLVSPGSTALLYGTQNIGLRLGFNYYL